MQLERMTMTVAAMHYVMRGEAMSMTAHLPIKEVQQDMKGKCTLIIMIQGMR
jgi:hypothetical protein